MLPFLEKKTGSASNASESIKLSERPQNKRDVSAALEVAMKELFSAQDDKSRALAFKAAFELLEAAPHKEGPHNG
jgi:hypothetical protein